MYILTASSNRIDDVYKKEDENCRNTEVLLLLDWISGFQHRITDELKISTCYIIIIIYFALEKCNKPSKINPYKYKSEK